MQGMSAAVSTHILGTAVCPFKIPLGYLLDFSVATVVRCRMPANNASRAFVFGGVGFLSKKVFTRWKCTDTADDVIMPPPPPGAARSGEA